MAEFLSEVGQAMTRIKTLEGLPKVLNLTKPVTNNDFKQLTDRFGKGQGDNAQLTAGDCLGNTNYIKVLNDSVALLTLFQSSANMNSVISKVSDIKTSFLTNSYAPFGSWHELIIDYKNTIDTLAETIKTETVARNNESLCHQYNLLAESHNTSAKVYVDAPFYTSAIGEKNQVCPSFCKELHSIGANADKFNADVIIEECSQLELTTGQAIIAAEREGKNINILNNIGIVTDSFASSGNDILPEESAPKLPSGGRWSKPVDQYASLPTGSSTF
jgi:hypothetical protein